MKKKQILDNLITIMMICLYSSLILFEEQRGGRYIILFFYFASFAIMLIRKSRKIKFTIERWHINIFLLAFYSLISSVWAINAVEPVQKFSTLVQILLLNSLLYSYYRSGDNIDILYTIIKWGGYIVCVYSIKYYGFNVIMNSLLKGVRLENGYNNINVIGVVATVSIIIELSETKYYGCLKKDAIFLIPAFMIVLGSQSKKAFIILALGIYLILNFNKKNSKRLLKKILIGIIVFIVAAVLIITISKLSIFSTINKRFIYLLEAIQGRGKVGSSSYIRAQMFKLGWHYFLKNPILGIGYGCPHFLVRQEMGIDAYLHNNYIELLCGGGIIGFILYYSMYFHLIKILYKYRNIKSYGKNISFLLIFLFLIMDFGRVTIYSKITYFQFFIFFLTVKQLKKEKKYLKMKKRKIKFKLKNKI